MIKLSSNKREVLDRISSLELWSMISYEPYFSWYACDLCDSKLGGDRYDYQAKYHRTIHNFSVCIDCMEKIEC